MCLMAFAQMDKETIDPEALFVNTCLDVNHGFASLYRLLQSMTLSYSFIL